MLGISFNDIEFVILFILIVAFFTRGLVKREVPLHDRYTGIDLSMSVALKGIACVLILMGHFAARKLNMDEASNLTRLIYMTTANIALALFMYMSGYGLSLKKPQKEGIIQSWLKRIKKVYLPLLLTCVVAVLLYCIIPSSFSISDSETLMLTKDIYYIHHYNSAYLIGIILHMIGWCDWYVLCIILFYSFFYLSLKLTQTRSNKQTVVLWVFMLVYFFFAYFFFGSKEAHFYRYCWIFFLGHVHGKIVLTKELKKQDMLLLLLLGLTAFTTGWEMLINYVIGIILIAVCIMINRKYIIDSRFLTFMGGISYFFYLSHIRIGYVLMSYTPFFSALLWTVITIMAAAGLKLGYDKLRLN